MVLHTHTPIILNEDAGHCVRTGRKMLFKSSVGDWAVVCKVVCDDQLKATTGRRHASRVTAPIVLSHATPPHREIDKKLKLINVVAIHIEHNRGHAPPLPSAIESTWQVWPGRHIVPPLMR